MKKNKYSSIYFYCITVISIGIYYIFFRRYLIYSFDGYQHLRFAQGLFQKSLEDMQQASLPVWAIAYPLYHIVLKMIAVCFQGDYFIASYILLSSANAVSIVLYRWMLRTIFSTESVKKRYFIDIISVLGIIFVTACGPLNGWRFYAMQCAANPVHNPTILFVRPFGIVCFTEFCLFLKHFMYNLNYIKNLILFSLFSFLSILAKPSFAFVFLPAMGVVVLVHMVKQKTLKLGIWSLAAIVPSVILLLWQFFVKIPGGQTLKIGVQFGSFSNFTWQQVICVSLVTFPVPIILFCWEALKNNIYYQVAMGALIVGWLQMFCLTNGPTGDFSWGYDLSVQFATLVALIGSCQYNISKWRRIAGYLAFLYQAVCGIIFIFCVYEGLDAWI